MALKDLNTAGQLGSGLATIAKTELALSNQYASASSPLTTLLTQFGLTASIPDNATTQAAVQTLISACVLPASAAYDTASASRFTAADKADANSIIQAVLVAAYVVGKMATATIPVNDI